MKECPYCKSDKGYYYDRTIRQRVSKEFTPIFCDVEEIEEIYRNTTVYCRNCDKSITSYVKSLGLE